MELSSDEKPHARIQIQSTPNVDSSNNNEAMIQEQQQLKGGTSQDLYDMNQMGKRPELRRNFRFVSIVGFVLVLQSTWESIVLTAQYGMINGGTAGVIWATVGVIFGALCMIASIAEMASIWVVDSCCASDTGSYYGLTGCLRAQTAGGQYHWVSEFAPKSLQKPLSYLVGGFRCMWLPTPLVDGPV